MVTAWPPHRRPDAGVTLTEMLVVLALIAVASGAAMLRLGSVTGNTPARAALEALAQDMRQASHDALMSGSDAVLEWRADAYRLSVDAAGDWTPLPARLRLDGTGLYRIQADGAGMPLRLMARGDDGAFILAFDGVMPALTPIGGQP